MDYIDKKALRNALFNGERNLYSWEEIEAKIDALPSVDIVWCKDCREYADDDGYCCLFNDLMNADDFCSRVTKRE